MFMEKYCLVSVTTDMSSPVLTHTFVKKLCMEWHKEPEELHHIIYLDLTKFGVLGQQELNKAVMAMKGTLQLNPRGMNLRDHCSQ